MIKLLMGGSPCTKWSIAQSKDRETKAQGIGWELFKNYLIAKEKFQPDFFLYENNWSASTEIKEQIQKELGCKLMRINSGLVSEQNRDRFYVFNWEVDQPEDKSIFLVDILESGDPYNPASNGKSHTLTANYFKTQNSPLSNFGSECHRQRVADSVRVSDIPNKKGEISGSQATRVYDINGKSVNLVANGGGQGAKTGLYAVPIAVSSRTYPRIPNGEPRFKRIEARSDLKSNCLTTVQTDSMVAKPVQYKIQNGCSIKFSDGKMRQGNENGSRQGTYVYLPDCKKTNAIIAGHASNEIVFMPVNNQLNSNPIYEVKHGLITINEQQYPIKLPDGYYIIRKLTPVECERLQTMPDGYTQYGAVQATEANLKKYNSKIKKGAAWVHKETNQICFEMAATNRYKGLGNGWTKSVIVHILSGALKNIPKDEKIILLSMYDGIGTAYQCLKDMGFTNVECHAYEIDENAMAIAMYNHPDIIQHGDAFQVRESSWNIMK